MRGLTAAHFPSFGHFGVARIPDAVEPVKVAQARREILKAIRVFGLTADEIASCQTGTFFPHLRWEPWIDALLPEVAPDLLGFEDGDVWCDPQILLRFPDTVEDWPVTYHRDTEPEWANGRRYKGIVGVNLTDVSRGDGGTLVVPRTYTEHMEVTGLAGDALVFAPDIQHSGSLNRGSSIRIAVFFRLLSKEV